MKKSLLLLILFIPLLSFGQFGVSFHESTMPFFGVSYEFGERFRPEIRLGTNNYFEDISLETVFTYDILNKPDYELYAGLGYRFDAFSGMVIPIGLNFYPFAKKNFGFHIEVAPILFDADILRGSLGIRYVFRSE